MSNNTDKQGTEVRVTKDVVDVKAGVDTRKMYKLDAQVAKEMLETDLAERFAIAILGNPRAEQILGVDPFSPGRAGDSANAGEHLAKQTYRLARQYLAALKLLAAGE